MGMEINWRSKPGTLTDDNRDYCGVGLRDDAALCVVLDGSTSGPQSGEFARAIAHDLIDWFIEAGKVSAASIVEQLRDIHGNLAPRFRGDSASFAIALIDKRGAVRLLCAGDCLVGLRDGQSGVDWQSRPHTLANAVDDLPIADIARSPIRNRLTRSFRGREFMAPDISELRLEGDQELVLATDGFWAALAPEAQAQFLAGEAMTRIEEKSRDDCSTIAIRRLDDSRCHINGRRAENCYIVSHLRID